MIHGYNGGLIGINRIVFILFVLYSCSHDQDTCEYSFKSLATNREQTHTYNLTMKEHQRNYVFLYVDTKDSTSFRYEIDARKKEMQIFMNEDFDDAALLQGEQQYELGEKTFNIECFKVNSERLGEDLLIFCNYDYGVLLLKATSFTKELTKFNGSTNDAIKVIELIKHDTIFYNYGGKVPDLPPQLSKP